VQNVAAVFRTVWAYEVGPKYLGKCWAPPLWDGDVDDPWKYARYLAEFGRSWVKNYKRTYGDLPEKFDPSPVAFQGQSGSSGVISSAICGPVSGIRCISALFYVVTSCQLRNENFS